jgi:hypothetical protein
MTAEFSARRGPHLISYTIIKFGSTRSRAAGKSEAARNPPYYRSSGPLLQNGYQAANFTGCTICPLRHARILNPAFSGKLLAPVVQCVPLKRTHHSQPRLYQHVLFNTQIEISGAASQGRRIVCDRQAARQQIDRHQAHPIRHNRDCNCRFYDCGARCRSAD